MITDDFNCARYRTGQAPGHYESYFQRANHPTQSLAFWVRYTIFSPTGRPQDAIRVDLIAGAGIADDYLPCTNFKHST